MATSPSIPLVNINQYFAPFVTFNNLPLAERLSVVAQAIPKAAPYVVLNSAVWTIVTAIPGSTIATFFVISFCVGTLAGIIEECFIPFVVQNGLPIFILRTALYLLSIPLSYIAGYYITNALGFALTTSMLWAGFWSALLPSIAIGMIIGLGWFIYNQGPTTVHWGEQL